MPIECNESKYFLFVFILCYECPHSQLGEGGSCQVAEMSAKHLKRGCKIYHLDEKNREFFQILKYFYPRPSKKHTVPFY